MIKAFDQDFGAEKEEALYPQPKVSLNRCDLQYTKGHNPGGFS